MLISCIAHPLQADAAELIVEIFRAEGLPFFASCPCSARSGQAPPPGCRLLLCARPHIVPLHQLLRMGTQHSLSHDTTTNQQTHAHAETGQMRGGVYPSVQTPRWEEAPINFCMCMQRHANARVEYSTVNTKFLMGSIRGHLMLAHSDLYGSALAAKCVVI